MRWNICQDYIIMFIFGLVFPDVMQHYPIIYDTFGITFNRIQSTKVKKSPCTLRPCKRAYLCKIFFFVFFPPFCPLLVRLQLFSASIWHNCSFHLCLNGLGLGFGMGSSISSGCCWLTLTRVFNICSVIVCLQRYSTVYHVIYAFFLLLPGPLNSQWKEISRKYCSGCLILFYPFFLLFIEWLLFFIMNSWCE